jgi:hypothetical protein
MSMLSAGFFPVCSAPLPRAVALFLAARLSFDLGHWSLPEAKAVSAQSTLGSD